MTTFPGRASVTYITQGEQAIGRREADVISTTLGSCVAVCLWDPVQGLGGMNHILLPEAPLNRTSLVNVGATAMDRLVNALLKAGCDRRRFRAKIFGGSAMVAGLSDIGVRNVAFARDWLSAEGVPCDGESVGGRLARQVRFWPATGRAQQKLVSGAEAAVPDRPAPPRPADEGEVELF